MPLIGIIPFAFTKDCAEKHPKLPNIVFFLLDDLGWTDLGCYGSKIYETPNIDHFAGESVRFTSAYAAGHVSSPTRASILTGKYPAALKLTDWLPGRRDFPFQKLLNARINQFLPFEEITIAEALKEQGYITAIIGKWHLGEDPSSPAAHGFDIQVPRWAKGWPNAGYHFPFKLDGISGTEGDYLTDRLTDEALRFIEIHTSQPFFLILSHFAVHDPIEGRPDLVEKYNNKLSLLPPPTGPPFILEGNPDGPSPISINNRYDLLNSPDFSGYSQLPGNLVKIKQHQDNPQFAAMVESIDESLGRVLLKLKELELEKNTIVIFVSDNGGMAAANFFDPGRVIKEDELDKAFATSNLPLRGAKGWLYEGGIRVPMIIKWPQHGKKGLVCDVPVISPDFFPTIIEMIGVKVPSEQIVNGQSLVPLLKGKNKLKRDAIYWHFPHYSNHGMQSPGGAIRCGDLKLIEYFENNTVQLFNLKDDLSELADIASSNPEVVSELLEKLRRWRSDIKAHMMLPNLDYQPIEE